MASVGYKSMIPDPRYYSNGEGQNTCERRIPVGRRNIFLTHSVYKGFPKIHLRLYQNDKFTGKLYPSTKGIALGQDEFYALKSAVFEMEKYLQPADDVFNQERMKDFYIDDKMIEDCLKNVAEQADHENLKKKHDAATLQENQANFTESQSVKSQKLYYGH